MRRRLLAIPIRWQLMVLVIATMAPLLVGLTLLYLDSTTSSYQNVIHNTTGTSQAFTLEQETLLNNTYTLLSTLADVAGQKDTKQLHKILAQVNRRSPEYLNLFYVSADGIVQVSVLPDHHTYLGDRSYVKGAISNRSFTVGSYQVGRITKQPTINCGYPVLDSSGKVIGVVAASIGLSNLSEMFRRSSLPAGSHLVMSDRNGAVLASTDTDTQVGLQETEYIRMILSNRRNLKDMVEEKSDQGVIYHHITPLFIRQSTVPYSYLRISIPRSSIMQTAHQRSQWLSGWLIPFVILPLVLSYIVGHRYISRRLNEVVQAARKLQAGDLSARSALEDDLGEIGMLSSVFNEMAGSVQKWYQQHQWAEKQLRDSETRYRNLVEQLPAVTYVMAFSDSKTEILFLNSHIEDICGYLSTEFIIDPKLWPSLVHRDDQAAYHASMNAAARREAVEFTYRIITKSGETRWIYEKSQRIESPQDDYVVIQGLLLDITDTQTMAAELHQSEARFKLLVQSMGEMVITLDQDYRVSGLYGSSADVPIGIVPDIGQKLTDFLPCLVAELHLRYLQLSDQGLPQSFEWSINQHDFDWYLLSSVSSVIHESNGHQGYVIVVKDITEIRMAEQERRQIDNKMQQAQRLESLGLLAGGIAHDFNNLLTSVMGHTSLAMASMPDDHPAYLELGHVSTATQYASDLVKQMLAYSGHSSFQKKILNLNDAVRDMTQLLTVSIPKNVTICTELDPNTQAIEADPVQLQQVLMNLVINAGESIGTDAGQTTVRTLNRHIGIDELSHGYMNDGLAAGTYTVVQVTDTGCGMDCDTLTRIYDPFFTTKFTGRGLGMAAVLGIMRSHNGGINAVSCPGTGSTFTLIFPSLPLQVPVIEKKPSYDWRSELGLCALVVDDEEGVRLVATAMLKRLGLTVETAGDGKEGVELVTANPQKYSLIIMDLTMPRMGGEEALDYIRQLRPDIPVIISSGFTEIEMELHSDERRFDAFLQKPYRLEQVKQVVSQVLLSSKTP
ncbi:MAG: PAS domain S-box protein [Armatimonadota bacterium]